MAEPLTGPQSHLPLPCEEAAVVLVQGSSSRSAAAAELSALPNLLLKPWILSSFSLGQKRVMPISCPSHQQPLPTIHCMGLAASKLSSNPSSAMYQWGDLGQVLGTNKPPILHVQKGVSNTPPSQACRRPTEKGAGNAKPWALAQPHAPSISVVLGAGRDMPSWSPRWDQCPDCLASTSLPSRAPLLSSLTAYERGPSGPPHPRSSARCRQRPGEVGRLWAC